MTLELQIALVAIAIALPLTIAVRFPTKPGRNAATAHIPRIGGFPIVTAFLLAPLVVAPFSSDARAFLSDDWPQFLALGLCGGVVFILGQRDDFRDLDFRVKFAVQFGAAIALYAADYRIGEMTLPGNGTVALGWLDPFVTVFWLVFITNAMNLIDGHDGVAAGVSAMVSATVAYVAWDLDHNLIAMLFAALAGASLGFVPLNLPSARRFLGDGGAYFLGFTIAGLSVAGSVDNTGRVPLYIPLVALGLPVLDTSVAFLRRWLNGVHPFHADMDHFHDRAGRLLHIGPVRVTLLAYAITAIFCASALGLHAWYKEAGSAVVGAAVLAFAILLVVLLGYASTMWNSARILTLRGRREQPQQTPTPVD
ncbi:MAG: MraY family glycosyltransferase [Dehalococcoidia bacterium]